MQNRTIEWLAALLAFCLLLGVAPAAAIGVGIQDRIDAASPGDTISIGSGTYNENVIVDKQVTLIGKDTGGGMPVVDGGDSDNTITVTADGVVIEGFEITNSYGSCPYAGIAVEADDVVIRDNVISSNGGHGIYVDEAEGTVIDGNVIADNDLNGIAGDYAVGTVIAGNTVENSYYNGIRFHDSEDTLIDGNTVTGNGEMGINVQYSYATVISGNTIEDNSYTNVMVQSCIDVEIDGNEVTDAGEYFGIRLHYVDDALITGNTVTGSYQGGVRVWSAGPLAITDNTVNGNGVGDYDAPTGIEVEYYETDWESELEDWADMVGTGAASALTDTALIADNTVNRNIGNGIVLYEFDNAVITRNECSGNGQLGIYVDESDSVEISENTALRNIKTGIKLDYSTDLTATGNTASMNGKHGLMLDTVDDSLVQGNTLTDNGVTGLILQDDGSSDGSSGNTITENTVSAMWTPILVDEYCYDNEIYLNDFLIAKIQLELDPPMPAVYDGPVTRAVEESEKDKEKQNEDSCTTPGKEKKNPVLEFILGILPRGVPEGDETLWNSPEAWHYKYNDHIFLNYTGNYWYDYNGTDANGDGIGDTPHEILTFDCSEYEADLGTDFYPLMESYTQYPEVKMLRPEGGSDTAEFDFVTDGTVLTSFEGKVYQTTTIASADGVAKLTLPRGTVAFDADGNPIREITIEAVDEVPAVPEGAVFTFAGYAYECTPAGATFDPAITLTFTLTAEEWEALEGDLTVRFYNAETGEWEDVPATYDPVTHTVTAEVSHFTVFALFAEGTAETAPAAETTTAEPTATAEPAETTAEATTAAPAGPTETPESPLVFAPVLGLLAFLFFARRH